MGQQARGLLPNGKADDDESEEYFDNDDDYYDDDQEEYYDDEMREITHKMTMTSKRTHLGRKKNSITFEGVLSKSRRGVFVSVKVKYDVVVNGR